MRALAVPGCGRGDGRGLLDWRLEPVVGLTWGSRELRCVAFEHVPQLLHDEAPIRPIVRSRLISRRPATYERDGLRILSPACVGASLVSGMPTASLSGSGCGQM